jgi:hypothetical protein
VISDQTVNNVLQRNGLPPAPERKRTAPWSVFIRTHLALLAGTDFFTAEVLMLRGLVTSYGQNIDPRLSTLWAPARRVSGAATLSMA